MLVKRATMPFDIQPGATAIIDMPDTTLGNRAPVAPVLMDLRQATGARHSRLEARLPFASAGFDQAAYRQLMAAYYGFYRPLEQLLAPVAGLAEVGWAERAGKSAVLEADLIALGFSATAIQQLPLCSELPAFDSLAALMGVLYVIEGATLGGQVLRARMAAKLGIGADDGGAFLDVYGPQTGRLWRSFLQRLGTLEAATERSAACTAASQTFDCFEAWLASTGVLV